MLTKKHVLGCTFCKFTILYYNIVQYFLCWCPCLRPATGNLLRVSVLVLHLILWAESAGRGDIPCLTALSHRGWLHGSVQRWEILPGFALQCEPQHRCGAHSQTYWYDTSSSLIHLLAIWFYTHRWPCEMWAQIKLVVFTLHTFLLSPAKVGECGCTTSVVKCLQSVWVTVPSLSKVLIATNAMAGTPPLCVRFLQVSQAHTKHTARLVSASHDW